MGNRIDNSSKKSERESSELENKCKNDSGSLLNVVTSDNVISFSNSVSIDLSDSPAYMISNLSDAIAVLKDLYYQGDFNGAYATHLIAFDFAIKKRHDHNKAELKRSLSIFCKCMRRIKKRSRGTKTLRRLSLSFDATKHKSVQKL